MRAYRQFAKVYDRLMEEMPYPEWLGFARKCWAAGPMPRTVVDLGCGTGSLAIPLAKSGFDVYGIDLSADMLTVARSKWEESPRQAVHGRSGMMRWLQQDMCDWELPEQVDTVICFCDSLNYLTTEEAVEAAFRATWRGLKPGGVFLFDVHPPSQLQRYAEEQPFVLDERDVAYIWTCELEEPRCEITHHLTIFAQDGESPSLFKRFEEVHHQRAYSSEWLMSALRRAGFNAITPYGDFKLEPPDEGTERLFFAAYK